MRKYIICFNCDKVGHSRDDCPEPRNEEKSNRICEYCGGRGHTRVLCPKLKYNIPLKDKDQKRERFPPRERPDLNFVDHENREGFPPRHPPGQFNSSRYRGNQNYQKTKKKDPHYLNKKLQDFKELKIIKNQRKKIPIIRTKNI